MGVLIKHGNHDQLDHGKWAQGRRAASRDLQQIADRALANAAVGRRLTWADDKFMLSSGDKDAWRSANGDIAHNNLTPKGAAKVIAAQGWDAPAQRVTTDEFDALEQSGDFVTVYRGGPSGLSDGMVNGEPYIGTGIDGAGTYVTTSPRRAATFGLEREGRNQYDAYVVRLLIPKTSVDAALQDRDTQLRASQAMDGKGVVWSRDIQMAYETEPRATDYLVWNTSALIVSPETRLLADTIRTRAESTYVLKAEDGLESGPYYAVRQGKAVIVEFDDAPVVKHGNHDQLDHGKWAQGREQARAEQRRLATTADANNISVQRHDPNFFTDLATAVGLTGRSSTRSQVMNDSSAAFPEERSARLTAMVESGELLLQDYVDGFLLDRLYELHGGDVERFTRLAVDGLINPNRMQEESLEMYARRMELRERVGNEAADSLLAQGRVNLEAYENNLNASVRARDAKMMAQAAVSSRMGDVDFADIHQAAFELGRTPFPTSGVPSDWEQMNVVVQYDDGLNEYKTVWPGPQNVAQVLSTAIGAIAGGPLSDPEVRQAYEQAVRETVTRQLISEWAKTSNKTQAAATVQRAAIAEFGLQNTAEPEAASPSEALDRVARSFVRAQYEATQAMFAEHLPETTHIRLFRGGDSVERYVEGGEGLLPRTAVGPTGLLESANVGVWTTATLNLRPMASFATTPAASNLFASVRDTTFAADVPVERILSTPFSGNGAGLEAEFVVLGGPIHGARLQGQVPHGPSWRIPDDLPLGATEFIMIDGFPVPIGKAVVVKHGNHDQLDHGKWAQGRQKAPAAEARLAPSVPVDRMYAAAMRVTSASTLSEEALSDLPPEVAAPYLKQHVSQGIADRVETTPEELWALGGLDTDSDRDWDAASADLVAGRRFGSLLPVVNRDPSLVTDEAFRERLEHYTALSGQALGGLYGDTRSRAKFSDGSWVLDAYGPPLLTQFGVDISGMTPEQRGVHIEALNSALKTTVVTPDMMANAIENGATIAVGRRDGTSILGLPDWSRSYREVGSLTDPAVVRAGVEYVSEKIVDSWAVSSNYKTSVVTQQAAQQEFGLQRVASPAEVESVSPQEMSMARKVVRAQYEATQELLDKQLGGATHVMLFRGGDSAQRYQNELQQQTNDALIRRLAEAPDSRDVPITPIESTLNLRPLASFSTSAREARNFIGGLEGTMFVAAVPKERIMSTAVTGLGSASEYEFVVLGGPIHGVASLGKQAGYFGNIMEDHRIALSEGAPPTDRRHAASRFPDWNLPMGATEFIMIDGFPVPIGKAVLVKHGNHDQLDHGKWAQGRRAASRDLGRIADRALANASRKTEIPESAFVVGEDYVESVFKGAVRQSSLREGGAAKVVSGQGWDLPAQRVTTEEFDALAARDDFVTVYRGGPSGLSDGMVDGEPYIGRGMDGHGTYVATDPKRATMYGMQYRPSERMDMASVVRLLVPRSLVDVADRTYEASRDFQPMLARKGQAVFRSKGLDGLQQDYIVLNTSAVIVSPETTVTKAEFDAWVQRDVTVVLKAVDDLESGPYFRIVNGKAVPITFDGAVVKHGDHDQLTHGNWATGRATQSDGRRSRGVAAVSERAVYEMYVAATGVEAGLDGDVEGIRQRMNEQAGYIKNTVASSLADRLVDALSVDDLFAVSEHLSQIGEDGGFRRNRLLPDGPRIAIGEPYYVRRSASGRVTWWLSEDEATGGSTWLDPAEAERGSTGVMGDVQSRQAVAYQFANVVLQSWAGSSQSIPSQYLQRAVSEMFDVSVERQRISDGNWRQFGKQYEALADAMYQQTQETLNAQFPDSDHVVLHRGGDDAARFNYADSSTPARGSREAAITLRPLASFSSDAATAVMFAANDGGPARGRVYDTFTAAVPKSRIFATAATGIGAANEYEFVVIGGPVSGTQTRSSTEREAQSTMADTAFITVNGQPIPVGVA